jgi:hypothetical protein
LPVATIEQIVGAQGSVPHGVLDIPIGRQDIGNVTGPLEVTFTADFEIHGDLYFQAPRRPSRPAERGYGPAATRGESVHCQADFRGTGLPGVSSAPHRDDPQILCAHLVFRHGFQILTSCDFLIASS